MRRRLLLSTAFRDLTTTPLHAQLPLSHALTTAALSAAQTDLEENDGHVAPASSVAPEEPRWWTLLLDLPSLAGAAFPGVPGGAFRKLESIGLGPCCKLRKVFTLRSPPPGVAVAPAPDSESGAALNEVEDAASSPVPTSLDFPEGVTPLPRILLMDAAAVVVGVGAGTSNGDHSRPGSSASHNGRSNGSVLAPGGRSNAGAGGPLAVGGARLNPRPAVKPAAASQKPLTGAARRAAAAAAAAASAAASASTTPTPPVLGAGVRNDPHLVPHLPTAAAGSPAPHVAFGSRNSRASPRIGTTPRTGTSPRMDTSSGAARNGGNLSASSASSSSGNSRHRAEDTARHTTTTAAPAAVAARTGPSLEQARKVADEVPSLRPPLPLPPPPVPPPLSDAPSVSHLSNADHRPGPPSSSSSRSRTQHTRSPLGSTSSATSPSGAYPAIGTDQRQHLAQDHGQLFAPYPPPRFFVPPPPSSGGLSSASSRNEGSARAKAIAAETKSPSSGAHALNDRANGDTYGTQWKQQDEEKGEWAAPQRSARRSDQSPRSWHAGEEDEKDGDFALGYTPLVASPKSARSVGSQASTKTGRDEARGPGSVSSHNRRSAASHQPERSQVNASGAVNPWDTLPAAPAPAALGAPASAPVHPYVDSPKLAPYLNQEQAVVSRPLSASSPQRNSNSRAVGSREGSSHYEYSTGGANGTSGGSGIGQKGNVPHEQRKSRAAEAETDVDEFLRVEFDAHLRRSDEKLRRSAEEQLQSAATALCRATEDKVYAQEAKDLEASSPSRLSSSAYASSRGSPKAAARSPKRFGSQDIMSSSNGRHARPHLSRGSSRAGSTAGSAPGSAAPSPHRNGGGTYTTKNQDFTGAIEGFDHSHNVHVSGGFSQRPWKHDASGSRGGSAANSRNQSRDDDGFGLDGYGSLLANVRDAYGGDSVLNDAGGASALAGADVSDDYDGEGVVVGAEREQTLESWGPSASNDRLGDNTQEDAAGYAYAPTAYVQRSTDNDELGYDRGNDDEHGYDDGYSNGHDDNDDEVVVVENTCQGSPKRESVTLQQQLPVTPEPSARVLSLWSASPAAARSQTHHETDQGYSHNSNSSSRGDAYNFAGRDVDDSEINVARVVGFDSYSNRNRTPGSRGGGMEGFSTRGGGSNELGHALNLSAELGDAPPSTHSSNHSPSRQSHSFQHNDSDRPMNSNVSLSRGDSGNSGVYARKSHENDDFDGRLSKSNLPNSSVEGRSFRNSGGGRNSRSDDWNSRSRAEVPLPSPLARVAPSPIRSSAELQMLERSGHGNVENESDRGHYGASSVQAPDSAIEATSRRVGGLDLEFEYGISYSHDDNDNGNGNELKKLSRDASDNSSLREMFARASVADSPRSGRSQRSYHESGSVREGSGPLSPGLGLTRNSGHSQASQQQQQQQLVGARSVAHDDSSVSAAARQMAAMAIESSGRRLQELESHPGAAVLLAAGLQQAAGASYSSGVVGSRGGVGGRGSLGGMDSPSRFSNADERRALRNSGGDFEHEHKAAASRCDDAAPSPFRTSLDRRLRSSHSSRGSDVNVPTSPPRRSPATPSAPHHDDGFYNMHEGAHSQGHNHSSSSSNRNNNDNDATFVPEAQPSVAEELARRKAELLALEDSFADEFGDSLDNDDDDDALGWTDASAPRRSAAGLRPHENAHRSNYDSLSHSNGDFTTKGLGLRSSSGNALGHVNNNYRADSHRYPHSDDAAVNGPFDDSSAEAYYSSRGESPPHFRSSHEGGSGGGLSVPTRTSPAKAAPPARASLGRSSRGNLNNAHATSAPGTEEEEGDETLFGTQQLDSVALPNDNMDADAPVAAEDSRSSFGAGDRGGLAARRRGSHAGVAGASAEALASLLQWAATEEREGGQSGERREGAVDGGEAVYPLAASSEKVVTAPVAGIPSPSLRRSTPEAPASSTAPTEALRPSALLAPTDDDDAAASSSAAFAEAAAPSPYLGSNIGPGSKGCNGGDDSLELVFNPVLNAYYDPSTGRFYHLKDDDDHPEPPH